MVILYTIGCTKCDILEKILEERKINHIKKTDVKEMEEKGIDRLPVLEIAGGELLNFSEAMRWINVNYPKEEA